jgi:hypothetical protein
VPDHKAKRAEVDPGHGVAVDASVAAFASQRRHSTSPFMLQIWQTKVPHRWQGYPSEARSSLPHRRQIIASRSRSSAMTSELKVGRWELRAVLKAS